MRMFWKQCIGLFSALLTSMGIPATSSSSSSSPPPTSYLRRQEVTADSPLYLQYADAFQFVIDANEMKHSSHSSHSSHRSHSSHSSHSSHYSGTGGYGGATPTPSTPVKTNTAPNAQDSTLETDEDQSKSFSLKASDPDGDRLTLSIVKPPSKGVVNGTSLATMTYVPKKDDNGQDQFTYRVYDGTEYSNIATVTISLKPVNDAPIADSIALSVIKDTPLQMQLPAKDVDGDKLTYTIISKPEHGQLHYQEDSLLLKFIPAEGYIGPDKFTYKVSDGKLESAIGTVSLTIRENHIPVAEDIAKQATSGYRLLITLKGTDVDGDKLKYTIIDEPKHGKLSGLSGSSLINYTSDDDFVGPDTFTYIVSDGYSISNIARVTLNVIPFPRL